MCLLMHFVQIIVTIFIYLSHVIYSNIRLLSNHNTENIHTTKSMKKASVKVKP